MELQRKKELEARRLRKEAKRPSDTPNSEMIADAQVSEMMGFGGFGTSKK